MAEWGKAHNRAYVGCIEYQLGINFTDINWKEIPDPERYRSLDSIDKASNLSYDVSYQSSLSKNNPPVSEGTIPPKINTIGSSNLPYSKTNWEQKLNVAFNLNLLKIADTFVSINDASTTPIPVDKQIQVETSTNAPCVLIAGENFQNCTVQIGGKAATNVWITKDGKQLYAIRLIETKDDKDQLKLTSDNKWRNQVTQKNASVIVINYEDVDKTRQVGQTTCKPEPTLPIVTDMGWEENAAKIVHNYLRSPDGQKAIRAYKARGWAPVKPVFQIRISDRYDKPLEAAPIKISRKDTGIWTDITDSNGEIHIYQGTPEDYKIWILGHDDLISKPERSVSELKTKALNFGSVKVSFITPPDTTETGPNCFKCKKNAAGNTEGWQRCVKCGNHFCTNCVKLLSYPKGTQKAVQAITEERACSECGDITIPITK